MSCGFFSAIPYSQEVLADTLHHDELLESDSDVLTELVETFVSYNGLFADDEVIPMDMLDEYFVGVKPSEFLPRVFYGHDADTSCEGNYTEFNPNREYFYFNGWGFPVNRQDFDRMAQQYMKPQKPPLSPLAYWQRA